MDFRELEITLEAALAVTRPSPRDVRDALVDYYATVARPFIQKGLSHTQPLADESVIRRMLMLRLGTLWNDLGSPWDNPSLEDLRVFRERIDRYACVRDDERLLKTRRLIDDLMLAAAVSERVRALKAGRASPKLEVIDGGGELSPPRGQLRIVGTEATG
jgi:hypothetical protein